MYQYVQIESGRVLLMPLPNIERRHGVDVTDRWWRRRAEAPARLRELASLLSQVNPRHFSMGSWLSSNENGADAEPITAIEGRMTAVARKFVAPRFAEIAEDGLTACGTTACAGGWATVLESSKTGGMRLEFARIQLSENSGALVGELALYVDSSEEQIGVPTGPVARITRSPLALFYGLMRREVSYLFHHAHARDIAIARLRTAASELDGNGLLEIDTWAEPSVSLRQETGTRIAVAVEPSPLLQGKTEVLR